MLKFISADADVLLSWEKRCEIAAAAGLSRLRLGNPVQRPAPPAAGSGPGDDVSPPLAPVARRLLGLAALLSVLLIAVVANWFLHSDGSPFNPIAAAAVRTQAAPGARFSLEAIYTSTAQPQAIVAHGRGPTTRGRVGAGGGSSPPPRPAPRRSRRWPIHAPPTPAHR